jgi:hypothetical protein
MKTRLIGTIATSPREFEICCGSSGVFFKMDRSQTTSYDNFGHNPKVFGRISFAALVCRRLSQSPMEYNLTHVFKTFCDQIGMKIHFASVRHPKSNSLVERANGIIITGIMKSIFNLLKGKWTHKLVKVGWNHNTVVSRSTGFTPFKLLFRDKAITPEEART